MTSTQNHGVRKRSRLTYEELSAIAERIVPFDYHDNRIRVVDGKWIVFSDVCKALGYKNPSSEAKKIDNAEVRKFDIGLKGMLANCISQKGLIIFSMFANSERVTEFRKWAETSIFGSKGE